MIQHTSMVAYALLQEHLTKAQFGMYKWLEAHPGVTAGEAAQEVGETYRKRLKELRERGVVRNGPERPCSITKRKCMTWFVIPDAMPRQPQTVKPPKPSEILAFVEAVERVHAVVEASNGTGLGPHATKVLAWLRQRAAS